MKAKSINKDPSQKRIYAWIKPSGFRLFLVAVLLMVGALSFSWNTATQSDGLGDLRASVSPTTVVSQYLKSAATAHLPVAEESRYDAVVDYMAHKYAVSRQVVFDLVKTTAQVGRRYGIDPLLLVAIIGVESGFNPIAESGSGAKGLMQVIPQFHLDKFAEFGGAKSAFDPRANIAVGAQILRQYLQASSGNLLVALQSYAGASPDRGSIYGNRVLNEKDRLSALLESPTTKPTAKKTPTAFKASPHESLTGSQKSTSPRYPASGTNSRTLHNHTLDEFEIKVDLTPAI